MARVLAATLCCGAEDKPCGEDSCEACGKIFSDAYPDYYEINCADRRGIDAMRELLRYMRVSPQCGKSKIYVLDECFVYDTPILTDVGWLFIGDVVNFGLGKNVLSVHVDSGVLQWRPIIRRIRQQLTKSLVKVTLSNGRFLCCTEDHKFWLGDSYVKAKDIKFGTQVRTVREGFLPETEKRSFLRCQLPSDVYAEVCEQRISRESVEESKENYHEKIWREKFFGGNVEDQHYPSSRNIYSNEAKKPNKICLCSEENIQNDAEAWCVPQNLIRRKRAHSGLAVSAIEDVRFDDGIPSENNVTVGKPGFARKTPEKLQIGSCQPNEENWYRNRRVVAQYPEESRRVGAEGSSFEITRVESVQVYNSGSEGRNHETSTENSQNYVYDLEVADNHNYFAGGVLVSNCHQLTTDSANALLKAFEDGIGNNHVVLCTTEQQEMLETLRTRAMMFEFKLWNRDEIYQAAREVFAGEGAKVSEANLGKFVSCCYDLDILSPRALLNGVDKVIAAKSLDVLSEIAYESKEVLAVCRGVFYGKWSDVLAAWSKEFNAESVRIAVCGYLRNVLLKPQNPDLALALAEALKELAYRVEDSKLENALIARLYLATARMELVERR